MDIIEFRKELKLRKSKTNIKRTIMVSRTADIFIQETEKRNFIVHKSVTGRLTAFDPETRREYLFISMNQPKKLTGIVYDKYEIHSSCYQF